MAKNKTQIIVTEVKISVEVLTKKIGGTGYLFNHCILTVTNGGDFICSLGSAQIIVAALFYSQLSRVFPAQLKQGCTPYKTDFLLI